MSGRAKLMKLLMHPPSTKPKRNLLHIPTRWNIVRGDTVQVIQKNHNEYGKHGTIKAVIRTSNRVIIENLNVYQRNIKGDPERGIKGKSVMMERSMHYSNVNLVDPVTGLPTRITYSFLEDGTKVRISKRSGAIIPKPEILKQMPLKSSIVSEESDTDNDEAVWKVSYEEKPSKWACMREDLLKSLETRGGESSSGNTDDATI